MQRIKEIKEHYKNQNKKGEKNIMFDLNTFNFNRTLEEQLEDFKDIPEDATLYIPFILGNMGEPLRINMAKNSKNIDLLILMATCSEKHTSSIIAKERAQKLGFYTEDIIESVIKKHYK